VTISIQQFWIIVLVSNRIEYWSNYLLLFEISIICSALLLRATISLHFTNIQLNLFKLLCRQERNTWNNAAAVLFCQNRWGGDADVWQVIPCQCHPHHERRRPISAPVTSRRTSRSGSSSRSTSSLSNGWSARSTKTKVLLARQSELFCGRLRYNAFCVDTQLCLKRSLKFIH